jgi:hypothetical protein
MSIINLELDEWFEKYKPIENHFNREEGPYENMMFETYGEEEEHVKKQNPNHIWTLINCENEESYIVSGWHFVDRNGYFITEHPWTNNEEIIVNDNEMISFEESIEACINFFISINHNLDKNSVIKFFKINHNINDKMTIGNAKYTAIDYYNEEFNQELSDIEQDKIHNYYSQLI